MNRTIVRSRMLAIILNLGLLSVCWGAVCLDHEPRWTGDTSITYNLDDLEHLPASGFSYCHWGNRCEQRFRNTVGGYTFLFTPLTKGPFDSSVQNSLFSDSDLFVLGHDFPTTPRMMFPDSAIWSPLDGSYQSGNVQFAVPSSFPLLVDLYRYLHFDNTLTNILDNQPVDGTATKLVILIHGWNPDSVSDWFTSNPAGAWLKTTLTNQLQATNDWKLVQYRWERDADTGQISDQGYVYSAKAAEIGYQHGWHLGELLANTCPRLEKVQLIAHSAGSWVARNCALYLLQKNPNVRVEVTLLDPYMPTTVSPLLIDTDLRTLASNLGAPLMSQLAFTTGNQRIFLLENYWSGDGSDLTFGTSDPFNWRRDDIPHRQVDYWDMVLPLHHYATHSGPIWWYADTVAKVVGLPPNQDISHFDAVLTGNGWLRSLFCNEPIIKSQPQDQTKNLGSPVTFSVAADTRNGGNSSIYCGSISYRWFKDGNPYLICSGDPTTFTIPSVTAGDAGLYSVVVSNSTGPVVSRSARLTVNTSIPTSAATPAITYVSPASLPTSSSPQLIAIYGANFKPAGDPNASSLIIVDPAKNTYVRTPTYISANQLQYNVTVLSGTGAWSVLVTNAGQAASSPKPFTVYAPTASAGALQVNLSPPGAQWCVDGGSYRNGGDPVTGLTPGVHIVSFKAVSGYTTPPNRNETIASGTVTTDSVSYTAIVPSKYTLTLNTSDSSAGGVTASPMVSGNNYTAGSIVQLSANANVGYHFAGWSGDLGGTTTPATITMSANRTVGANFVSGDSRLGTMTLTILPAAAAAAGVQWGWTPDDYRNSGTSVISFPGTYIFTIHPVDGWVGPNQKMVTITAGQTTNATVTFTQDTTPGLLTGTLSPQNVVSAGGHWHVNGGAAQGNGSTVSLAPGTNYSVTFDSVAGWVAPAAQTVAVHRGQTTIVSGTYTLPTGQPAIAAIYPGFGGQAGGTVLTIQGVNFTAPATVVIGGRPATSVSVVSPSQIVCSTPSNSLYGTMPVVVQTPDGSVTNLNGFAYGTPRGNGIDLVTSLGGYACAVAVQGTNAYLGEGSSFLVLDISNPASPSRIGRLAMPGKVQDIALFGQYALVANADAGLQVVDISNPVAPSLKGFFSTPGWASGIAVLGSRAYVADGAGLEVFDVSNAAYPAFISSTNYNGAADDVAVKATTNGVFVYLVANGILSIIDATNPSSLILRGHLNIGDYTSAIAVWGNYVFAALPFGGFHQIDVSNPDLPIDRGSASSIGQVDSVAVANNLVYAAGAFFSVIDYGSGSPSFLAENGSIASLCMSSYGYNATISGNRAYLAAAIGLQVVDVSSSSNPSVLTTFTDSGIYGDYYSVALSGNYLFAAGSGGLRVFDVSNPAQPNLLCQNSSVNASQGQILLKNGFAFISCSGGSTNRVQVFDVSNPASPSLVGGIPVTTIYPNKIALSGNNLLVAGANTSNQARFLIADVSTPASPAIHGVVDFSGCSQVLAVAAVGNKAVIVVDHDLKVLDISNIDAPVQQGGITNVGVIYEMQMSADGHYAYLPDRISSLLRVIDVSNPNSPVQVGSVPVAGASWGVNVQGSVVYVSAGVAPGAPVAGVYGFDVSNPAAPTLIRSYWTPGPAYCTAFETDLVSQQGTMFVADLDAGIVVLKTKDTENPQVLITDPTFAPIYTNTTGNLNLGGSASDNVGVTRVTWSNSRGGGGNAVGTVSWAVSGIILRPGTNVLTVTAFDQANNSGSNVLTVIYPVTNQNQTILFSPIVDHTVGDPPILLSAAASSGLPVTFSVVAGDASLSNNVLTLTGAGYVIVGATQAGNDGFNAAPEVDVSFNVAKSDQSIAFAVLPDRLPDDPPFALTASSSSGLPVLFSISSGPAIIETNVVTILGAGIITVSAWQPGDLSYNAAVPVQRSFNVAKRPQSISFGPLSRQAIGDAPFFLSASASSDLPVTFTLVSGPAVLYGNMVTVTSNGVVIIRASQLGDAVFAPADSVSRSFVVGSGAYVTNTISTWAIGTFNGYVEGGGVATMTVTAKSKVTGRITAGGSNYTFASSYAAGSDPVSGYSIVATAKVGKVGLPLELLVAQQVITGDDAGNLGVATGTLGSDKNIVMYRNVWKDADMAAVPATVAGYYTATMPGDGTTFGSGYLALTLDAKGNVKTTGKMGDGTALSLSSTLLIAGPDTNLFTVIYYAPTAYKGGCLFGLAALSPEGTNSIVGAKDSQPFSWVNRNPQATETYGDGFDRSLDLVGGWYDKVGNLARYYTNNLTVGVGSTTAPDIMVGTESQDAVCWNPDGQSLSILTSGGVLKGIAALKAGAPAKVDGAWTYDATNAVGLTFGLTRATGIYKGSFKAWFDYGTTHVGKPIAFEGMMTPVRSDPTDGVAGRGFYLWSDKATTPVTYTYKTSYDFLIQDGP